MAFEEVRNNIASQQYLLIYCLVYVYTRSIELKLAISVWQQDLYLSRVLLHRTDKCFVIRLYMKFNILNECEIFFECFFLLFSRNNKNNYIYRPIQLIHKIP